MEPANHKRPRANRTRKRPGPKPVAPTDDQRGLVMLGVSIGMTADQIAVAIGLSRPTLYRIFSYELATGRSKRLLTSAARLDEMAEAGNVSAAKFLHTLMLDRGEKSETADDNEWEKLADELNGNLRQNPDFREIN